MGEAKKDALRVNVDGMVYCQRVGLFGNHGWQNGRCSSSHISAHSAHNTPFPPQKKQDFSSSAEAVRQPH